MMEFTFPFPPSTNTYWRHVPMNGRVRSLISRAGRAYRKTVVDIVLETLGATSAWPALQGDLACVIDLYPPDKRIRDADNYTKALLDAIEHTGAVFQNDSQIKSLWIKMHQKTVPGRVNLRVEVLREPID